MGRGRWLPLVFAFLAIITILCPLIRPSDGTSTFKPTVTKPSWVDKDNNSIADTLDQEIADKIASGRGDDYVSVVVMLGYEPTDNDLQAFASAGGNVTDGPWIYAIYGFGGTIPYDKISSFVQNCSNVLLIEGNGVGFAVPEYSVQIVLFVMMGIALLSFSTKKIAKNKERGALQTTRLIIRRRLP